MKSVTNTTAIALRPTSLNTKPSRASVNTTGVVAGLTLGLGYPLYAHAKDIHAWRMHVFTTHQQLGALADRRQALSRQMFSLNESWQAGRAGDLADHFSAVPMIRQSLGLLEEGAAVVQGRCDHVYRMLHARIAPFFGLGAIADAWSQPLHLEQMVDSDDRLQSSTTSLPDELTIPAYLAAMTSTLSYVEEFYPALKADVELAMLSPREALPQDRFRAMKRALIETDCPIDYLQTAHPFADTDAVYAQLRPLYHHSPLEYVARVHQLRGQEEELFTGIDSMRSRVESLYRAVESIRALQGQREQWKARPIHGWEQGVASRMVGALRKLVGVDSIYDAEAEIMRLQEITSPEGEWSVLVSEINSLETAIYRSLTDYRASAALT